jgi:hypothetical protein
MTVSPLKNPRVSIVAGFSVHTLLSSPVDSWTIRRLGLHIAHPTTINGRGERKPRPIERSKGHEMDKARTTSLDGG